MEPWNASVLIASAWVACALSACTFSPSVPPPAVIHCDSSTDCPAGEQCNVGLLRCVAAGADIDPPGVTSVAFDPPSTNGGVARLVIDADEALNPAADPLVALAAGSAALPFTAAEIVGSQASFTVDTAAVLEGAYAIGRVEVQDLAGNTGAIDVVNVSLVVDRTPPTLVNVPPR